MKVLTVRWLDTNRVFLYNGNRSGVIGTAFAESPRAGVAQW